MAPSPTAAVPAAQERHAEASASGANLPASQALQASARGCENWPAAHAVQFTTFPGLWNLFLFFVAPAPPQ